MKEYQIDFKALKSKVGIDDVAFSLGYQVDRKAGLGRYETSAKLSLPLINSLITTLNLKIKPI